MPIDLELASGPPFQFPLQGINDNWARSAQPAATTPDCLNVMPYDLTYRGRGGIRPGFNKTLSTNLGGTNVGAFVQGMCQLDSENNAGVRTSRLFVAAGGKGYIGTSLASLTVCGGLSFGSNNAVAAVGTLGGIIFVEGTGIYQVNLAGPTIVAYAPSGTAPTRPRLVCSYRSRVIFAQTADGNPENFFASAIGSVIDLNYGATGPGAAFAGNDARAGQIGEPITALMPLGDDALVIGCDHSLWLMSGDIANGGRIDLLNGGVGTLGQNAWCLDPTGNLYMLGTGGFFRLARGSLAIENLSLDKYNSAFGAVSRSAYTSSLVYDRDRHGVWIFRYAASGSSHFWFDERTGGFFPVGLPAALAPTCAMVYDGGTVASPRAIILGGVSSGGSNDAHIYSPSDTALTDDGTAISSYCFLGPIRPEGVQRESKLLASEWVMGEVPGGISTNNFGAAWQLQSGKAPGQALLNPSGTVGGSFTSAGRQKTQRSRLKGSAFFAKVTGLSGKTWSIDEIQPRLAAAGRVR